MATSDQHIQQWKHNRSLINKIPTTHPDWIATLAFYTALQAVDALLINGEKSPQSHKDRNQILQHTNTYTKIWKHYGPLYQLCRTVRYSANPTKWIPLEQVKLQIFERNLYQVEGSVRKLLNREKQIFPEFQQIELSPT